MEGELLGNAFLARSWFSLPVLAPPVLDLVAGGRVASSGVRLLH